MGYYQPRFGIVQWKRCTDLKMRDPNDAHSRQVELLKKHIAEHVTPYQECDKLIRAYDEERIHQNKVNSMEFLRARTTLLVSSKPEGNLKSRPLTDLEQPIDGNNDLSLKRMISQINTKIMDG